MSGVYPAGTSPNSYLVPNDFVPAGEPPGILADAIDPTTGEYLSISEGFDPEDAWVLGQLALVRGSGSALGAEDGRDFSEVTHLLERHRQIFLQEIVRPLKRLVDDSSIAITSVEVEEEEVGTEAMFVGYLAAKENKRENRPTVEVDPHVHGPPLPLNGRVPPFSNSL